MALFTDRLPADIELLSAYESSILDVAQTEGINLDTKLSLTTEEIADRILIFLIECGDPAQVSARRSVGLQGVVITPAMRRWHALRALENTFQDAYGSQRNERYHEKAQQYQVSSGRAEEEYFRIGVGVVQNPVPMGSQPVTDAVGADGQTYYACVTRIDTGGIEGGPGKVSTVTLVAGTAMSVPVPLDARFPFWNIYLGMDKAPLALQNAVPLQTTETWVFPGTLTTGRPPGDGQRPDYYVVNQQKLGRG